MSTSQLSHRHHYVPQFYLRQWAGPDGKLHRYKRELSGKLSEKSEVPKATGFRDDLYTVGEVTSFFPHAAPDIIETDFFGPIDRAAAPVLKCLASDSVPALSDEDRASWALFLNSLLQRHPQAIHEKEQIAPMLAEQVRKELLAKSPDRESWKRLNGVFRGMNLDAVNRNSVREHMVKEIRHPRVIDYFKKLHWVLLPKPHDVDFITTDAPLLINCGQKQQPIQFVSIALSPHRIMLMFPGAWQNDFNNEFLQTYAIVHNSMLVEGDAEFLYSRGPLRDSPVARVRLAAESAFGRKRHST